MASTRKSHRGAQKELDMDARQSSLGSSFGVENPSLKEEMLPAAGAMPPGGADVPPDPRNPRPTIEADLPDTGSERLRRAMEALGEPHRFQLAVLLSEATRSVGEVVAATGWPQPLVSHHLAGLYRAGLVAVRRDGRRRLYRLAEPEEPSLASLLEIFLATLAERSRANEQDAAPLLAQDSAAARTTGRALIPAGRGGLSTVDRSGQIDDYLL
jgi:DNA-binding transcriptional ArsR family regulator